VAWISERKDVLSTLFALLSLMAYEGYARSIHGPNQHSSDLQPATCTFQRSGYYALTLIFFALALMSKAMVVTLPFLMLLLDFWPLQRMGISTANHTKHAKIGKHPEPRNSRMEHKFSGGEAEVPRFRIPFVPFVFSCGKGVLLEKIPFFIMAAASTILASVLLKGIGGTKSLEQLSFWQSLAATLNAYREYLLKFFWPVNLAVFYPRPHGWPVSLTLISVLLVVGVSVVALLNLRRRPYLAVGWFWFLGTLLPVTAVPLGDHWIADRYTYFPYAGLCLTLVWAVCSPTRESVLVRRVFVALGVLMIAGCCWLTHAQVAYWQNSRTLLEHELRVAGETPMVHNNLGSVLGAEGNWPEAQAHFEAALRLQPGLQTARLNLVRALGRQGKNVEAIKEIQGLTPVYESAAHSLLGEALKDQNQPQAAIEQYREATHLNADDPVAQENLGLLLAGRGRIAEAIEPLTALAELKPGDAEAHYHLALALSIEEKAATAIEQYRKAIALKPDWAEALNDLAWLLATTSQTDLRNGTEAVRLAQRACETVGYKEARFLGTLDAAYAEAGQLPEALTTAELCRNMALEKGEVEVAKAAENRLKLYHAGRKISDK
jgi:protein O-mannosyl-transferase